MPNSAGLYRCGMCYNIIVFKFICRGRSEESTEIDPNCHCNISNHNIFILLWDVNSTHNDVALLWPGLYSSCKWKKSVIVYHIYFVASCLDSLHLRSDFQSTLLWIRTGKFKVCKSVHHRTIQINHQPDATIFQFIILTFIYSSTCFGRSPGHHQELNDCSGSLWFYLRIVVTVVLFSWSWL